MAEDRVATLRLSALQHLSEWELIFAGYLTCSEVWGKQPHGLTEEEVLEIRLAYDEWDRFRRAYETWERGHDPSEPFDRREYIRKRTHEIVERIA